MVKGKVPEFVIVEKEVGPLGQRVTSYNESALLAGTEVSWQKCWPMFDSS